VDHEGGGDPQDCSGGGIAGRLAAASTIAVGEARRAFRGSVAGRDHSPRQLSPAGESLRAASTQVLSLGELELFVSVGEIVRHIFRNNPPPDRALRRSKTLEI